MINPKVPMEHANEICLPCRKDGLESSKKMSGLKPPAQHTAIAANQGDAIRRSQTLLWNKFKFQFLVMEHLIRNFDAINTAFDCDSVHEQQITTRLVDCLIRRVQYDVRVPPKKLHEQRFFSKSPLFQLGENTKHFSDSPTQTSYVRSIPNSHDARSRCPPFPRNFLLTAVLRDHDHDDTAKFSKNLLSSSRDIGVSTHSRRQVDGVMMRTSA